MFKKFPIQCLKGDGWIRRSYDLLSVFWTPILHKPCETQGFCPLLNILALSKVLFIVVSVIVTSVLENHNSWFLAVSHCWLTIRGIVNPVHDLHLSSLSWTFLSIYIYLHILHWERALSCVNLEHLTHILPIKYVSKICDFPWWNLKMAQLCSLLHSNSHTECNIKIINVLTHHITSCCVSNTRRFASPQWLPEKRKVQQLFENPL